MRIVTQGFRCALFSSAFVLGIASPVSAAEPELHRAVRDGAHDRVILEIGGGADVNGRNPSDSTPLYLASKFEHTDIARLLITTGADVNGVNGMSAATALHEAKPATARLLIAYGAHVNAADRKGRTPLHRAASEGLLEVAELLLQAGADVNVRAEDGATPLHESAANVAELLLFYGADPNVQDARGASPLHRAAGRGDESTVRLLLQLGGDPTLKDQEGASVLHRSVARGATEVTKLLLLYGVAVNEPNEEGLTPLGWSLSLSRDNPAGQALRPLGAY